MANKLDSTSLFLAQVNRHAEVLGGLLSGEAEGAIDGERLGKCIVSTRMLARSASLMELPEWQEALESYERLLDAYRERSLPWDERIAQVTSEFIEKEDSLTASACDPEQVGLGGVVSAEELKALSREVTELIEWAADSPEGAAAQEGRADEDQHKDEHKDEETRADTVAPHSVGERSQKTGNLKSRLPVERGLEASMAELRRHAALLQDLWAGSEGVAAGSSGIPAMRTELLLIGFHALSMDRIIESRRGDLSPPTVETLAPLRVALQDYARVVTHGTDRRIDFTLSGESRRIDPRLLHPIHRVLQHMVGDVFLRCEERHLKIAIAVEESQGALQWSLRDNGMNFVSDSRLDGDEYLAFYPGLRDTRRILAELYGLLWVERDGNRGTRFAFTTPTSLWEDAFVVWGEKKERIAVLASQVVGVQAVEDVEFAPDSHGERIVADGRQVRVLRLGDLYSFGPVEGDRIAVIGALEKRIAFYVSGPEALRKGRWNRNGTAAGRAAESGTAQVGDERLPLVEAGSLLQKYISIVEAISEEDVSGGANLGVSVPSHTQAEQENDAEAPPEPFAGNKEVDVLIVEQSDSLRKALETLLSRAGFATRAVADPEAALSFLEASSAGLVVCDFRVPTMAAKTVVDRLRERKEDIPVLVTTSHRGQNAELLVERLGAAGYIGKPVDEDALVAQVASHIRRPVGRFSGTL